MTLLEFIQENKGQYNPKIKTERKLYDAWKRHENSILMAMACRISQHDAEMAEIETAKRETEDGGDGIVYNVYKAISQFNL